MVQHSGNDSFPDRIEGENVAAALIVIILTVVGVIGNGLVIMSYFVSSTLRSHPGNAFVSNLALTDFMCAVYVQVPCIFNLANPELHFTGRFCVCHSVITWTIMTASNWTLAAISVDRAIAVNRPFQHRVWVTTFKVRFAIAAIWFLSLILACSLIREDFISFNSWELMCTPKWTSENFIYAFVSAIMCFWIPSVILLLSNGSIICAVRRLKSVVVDRCPEATQQDNHQFCPTDYVKTLRSLYVLVAVYLLCAIPYFWAKFSFIHDSESGLLPKSVLVLTIILMFFATAINPFIYAILRKDHRIAFLKCAQMIFDKFRSVKSKISGSSEVAQPMS